MKILIVADENISAKKRLADILKELRGEETQRQFAKRLGTSYTSIQDWEKQIRLPSEKNLRCIARLKDWTYEQLVLFIFESDDRTTISITTSGAKTIDE